MVGNKVLSQYRVQKEHPGYEAFKKSLFRLKLDGTYEPVLRMAYMMGYVNGHNFGSGNLSAATMDEEFDHFKRWLDEQCRDEKPT